MPFINGRYHINPAMGQALDAAREAEAARLELEHDAHPSSPADDFAADPTDSAASEKRPIHHIEIEAAELEGLPDPRQGEPGRSVPSSTGRAAHGFVARIHRATQGDATGAGAAALRPETHVFTDHRDLLDFLRNELTKHCSQS